MDYTRDLTQEESFCAALYEVQKESLLVRKALFLAIAGRSAGKNLQAKHRDRRHRLEGKVVGPLREGRANGQLGEEVTQWDLAGLLDEGQVRISLPSTPRPTHGGTSAIDICANQE